MTPTWLVDAWTYRRHRRLDDAAWLDTILASVEGRAALPMPGFPSGDLQAGFVGSANEQAIREAWTFYALMCEWRDRCGLRWGLRSQVLDFGCGWGRFSRMFLRDVPPSGIWCADVLKIALDTCRDTGVPGRLIQLDPMPPSSLPDRHFDIAFAYSVFSHLSPSSHRAWRQELARVVKPGAIVAVTTQHRWFIEWCEALRKNPAHVSSVWHQYLTQSFVDKDAALACYDRGEMVYEPNGGGPDLGPEFYGEAVVPRAYFENEWGADFELLEFIGDRMRFEQAVAVMRRRP